MRVVRINERDDVTVTSRRRFMIATGTCLTFALPRFSSAHGVGIVNPPITLPMDVTVVRDDGTNSPLRKIIQGRRTLLQLMFTGCSETCPLQGALFAEIQDSIAKAAGGDIQMLSLSIDPMDNARSLSTWLSRFAARKTWVAAVPSSEGINVIRTSLQRGGASTRNHSSQVYFIDELGRLVWRTEDFPSIEIVVAIMQRNGWITSGKRSIETTL